MLTIQSRDWSKLYVLFIYKCLCCLGPGVNKAVLLQIQEQKAKAVELQNKNIYDNMSFENNEKTVNAEPTSLSRNNIIPNNSQEQPAGQTDAM